MTMRQKTPSVPIEVCKRLRARFKKWRKTRPNQTAKFRVTVKPSGLPHFADKPYVAFLTDGRGRQLPDTDRFAFKPTPGARKPRRKAKPAIPKGARFMVGGTDGDTGCGSRLPELNPVTKEPRAAAARKRARSRDHLVPTTRYIAHSPYMLR